VTGTGIPAGKGSNFEYGLVTGTGNGPVLRIRVGYQRYCTRRPVVARIGVTRGVITEPTKFLTF